MLEPPPPADPSPQQSLAGPQTLLLTLTPRPASRPARPEGCVNGRASCAQGQPSPSTTSCVARLGQSQQPAQPAPALRRAPAPGRRSSAVLTHLLFVVRVSACLCFSSGTISRSLNNMLVYLSYYSKEKATRRTFPVAVPKYCSTDLPLLLQFATPKRAHKGRAAPESLSVRQQTSSAIFP